MVTFREDLCKGKSEKVASNLLTYLLHLHNEDTIKRLFL